VIDATLPILYSFRRCPYAIRARMALQYSGINVALREVVLKDKPPSMIAASEKATVPVLILNSGEVLEESLDIMFWSLAQRDIDNWLPEDEAQTERIHRLITKNDFEFKPWLDRYKYYERYPEQDKDFYCQKACEFLEELEDKLQKQACLLSEVPSLADIAIFPFIRQFANSDRKFFDHSPYPKLKIWLNSFLVSPSFDQVMAKFSQWHEGDSVIVFP